MLLAIRDKAQGWIAWAIVILITIPFALFGIQEYLGTSSNPAVASVNGVEINEQQLERRVREFRESMRITLGNAYREDLFDDAILRTQVLSRMVDESLLQQAADDWNMRTSDGQVRAYIRSIPSFQNEGQFSKKLYDSALRARGMNNAGFEDLVRTQLAITQIQNGLRSSSFVTDASLAQQVELADQKRDLSFLTIPAEQFNDQSAITEEEARKYYQDYQAAYKVPERVKLAYLHLSAENLMDQVEVSDEDLMAYFDEHSSEFVVAEERRLRHILIASDGDDEAKAGKAQALLDQLRAGADFAALAKENSDDPGSAEKGGDLDWVNKGMMVKPFEEAGFSLGKDEISDVVKTQFGYHIIQATDIRGGGDATFEDVRYQVDEAYRKQQAEDLYFNAYEQFADTTYESPESLEPAADALQLKIQTTDWLTRNDQLPAPLDAPKVINTAFDEDVLQGGNNSQVIELGPTDALVLRVAEHEIESVKPFETVKDDVTQAAARSMASEKAAEKGKVLLADLKGGSAQIDALASANNWTLNTEKAVSREHLGVPAEVLAAAFATKSMAENAAFAGLVNAKGDYVLLAVTAVANGDVSQLEGQAKDLRRNDLRNAMNTAEMANLLQILRDRADVETMLKGEKTS